MTRTITWLHLSDLHARLRDDWDARQITEALTADLKRMQGEHGIRPDVVFFTGDAAFGAVGSEKMEDQYQRVRAFLDAVRRAFEPELPLRDLYLVPGNHDVDRNEITPDQISWLRHPDRKLTEILDAIRDGKRQWRAWMERLATYRQFITSYGLLHLQPDDPRLIWTDSRDIRGTRVGIAGFNSAWSCADDQDKGRLWCGTEWQVSELQERMGPVDFSFALIHHPGNWFTDREDPSSMRRLRQVFPVLLHGHEHAEWVEIDQEGRLVVSAGACYQCSWMQNGYSFGHLDCDTRAGWIRLRQWDATGRGWVARNIADKTSDGVWPLKNLAWLARPATSIRDQAVTIPTGDRASSSTMSVPEHYTRKFCQHVITQNDVLELFGCNIPKELQKHQLSVAYVSLNISAELLNEKGVEVDSDKEAPSSPSTLPADTDLDDEDDPPATSAAIEVVLDRLPPAASRLLIFGPAGAGKSTLLRWCAVHAANNVLEAHRGGPEVTRGWRDKIPILIRLRECMDGRLPAANDWPRFLAKHLPSAPADWMTNLLDEGHALVLLDGVDEVHRDRRAQLCDEIGALIRTYPRCTYVVTTRQGAVEPGWLDRLEFNEARVEPMNRSDREEFIDRWYRSAALETKHRPRPGEDLIQTTVRLKMELADQPELATLATNPLLCAMICALYRERQERLPETPHELCEDLCQMLLHRRERETPGLPDVQFITAWRELQYTQKKALLADLAWQMVNKGEPSIDMPTATLLIAKGLAITPGRTAGEAAEVLQALVERSGLLRPIEDERVEFIHNMLKEYLAASFVVESGDWEQLTPHADDSAWQPVILFALSRGNESFNSPLVRSLLERVLTPGRGKGTKRRSGIKNLSKAKQIELMETKAREFFLVRCRAAAKRLATDISTRIDELLRALLPPMSMHEAEALAQVGPKILLYCAGTMENPQWWPTQSRSMCIRCLRLLRRIGGPRAKTILGSITRLPSSSPLLIGEWMLASSELYSNTILPWPFADALHISISNTRVWNLRPLTPLLTIQSLDLGNTHVELLDPISNLTSLVSLVLRGTTVFDLSPLARLRELRFLSLMRTLVADLSPIAELISLQYLDLEASAVYNLCPIAGLNALSYLDVQKTRIRDLTPLTGLPSLQTLRLQGTRVPDLSPICSLPSLEDLALDDTAIVDLGQVADLSTLTTLSLRHTRVRDLMPLNRLKVLRYLSLRATPVTDLGPLSRLRSLRHLDLSGTPVTNLAPLAQTSIETVVLTDTKVHDLNPLLELKSLTHLTLGSEFADKAIHFSKLRPEVRLMVASPPLPWKLGSSPGGVR